MDTTAQEQGTPVTGGFLARHFWWVVGAVAVACALITVRAGRSAGFMDDDLANLGYGKRYGFGPETFLGLAENRDHILPATAVLNKLLSGAGPYWWMAQGISAVLVALLVLAVALMVRELSGSAGVAATSAFLAGTSIIVGRIALWWTSSALELPMLALSAITVWLAVRWFRERSGLKLVGCVAAQVGACAFYDRAAIVPLLVWAVLLILPPAEGPIGRQLLSRTRSALPLLLGLFAVVVIQVGATLLLASANTSPGFAAAAGLSVGDWLSALGNWWVRGVAGVLTNTVTPLSIHKAGDLLTPGTRAFFVFVLGTFATLLLLVLTVRNLRAVLAWLALFIVDSVSGAQIVAGRIDWIGGVGIATIPRYQDLTLLAFCTLVPLAWAVSGKPRPRVPVAVAAALLAAIGLALVVQLRAGIRESLDRPIAAGTYARNLQESLAGLPDGGAGYTLLDDRVPAYVMGAIPQTVQFASLSSAVDVLAPGSPRLPFNREAGKLLISGPDGRVAPAVLSRKRTAPERSLRCISTSPGSRWLEGSKRVMVPVSREAAASLKPLVVNVGLRASDGQGSVGITPVPGQFPAGTLSLADYPNGFRFLVPGGASGVAIDFWGGARTCIASLYTANVSPSASLAP